MSRGAAQVVTGPVGRVLGLACGLSAACSEPGHTPAALLETGVGDAGVADAASPDAEADGGGTPLALCDRWCEALVAACGPVPAIASGDAGDGADAGVPDCAADCAARVQALRGTCPDTFRAYFGCLLDTGGWNCVSPGVARVVGCEDEAEPWRACAR